MMDMMGLWMILWLIIGVVVLGLAAAGAVWLVRSMTSRPRDSKLPSGSNPAQEELRRQYAAGNIDREEYLRRKIDLEP